MSKDYKKLADFILGKIGGKDNIVNIDHCITRLRIKLKDELLVDETALNKCKDIISTQHAEGKLQIIIGTDVADVHEAIEKKLGVFKEAENENLSNTSILSNFSTTIVKIIGPALGCMSACALMTGLYSILNALGLIAPDSGAYIILSKLSSTAITFFPVILGYTSAKVFGMSPYLGLIIGAALMYPDIASSLNSGEPLFTLFENSAFAMPVYKTFFGIPVIFPATGYSSTVLPIVIINYFGAKIEKYFKRNVPEAFSSMFVPFLTMLVTFILGILALGPISLTVQNALQLIVSWMLKTSKILTYVFLGAIYQPAVVFGLHWPIITLIVTDFVTNGYNNSGFGTALSGSYYAQIGACLAVYFRTRNKTTKGICLSTALSSYFGILEPAFYGVTLPVKRRFIYCIIANTVSAIIFAITGAKGFALGGGWASYIDPVTGSTYNLIWALIACLTAAIISFVLTWITYKPGENEPEEDVGA